MRWDLRSGGSWRPRKGTVAFGVVLAVAGAGVGWAASGATSPGVITACVDPASGGQLIYSASGTCASGQTTVQWNQQGIQGLEGPTGQQGAQGPPGAAAANSGVVAWGPSKYSNGFTITAQITTPGTWVIDGNVSEIVTPNVKARHTLKVECSLLTGPQNGSATEVASSSQTFFYHPATKSFSPSGFTGPVDEEDAVLVAKDQTPLEVYFSCKRLVNARTVIYYNPKITIEPGTTATFHQQVAPALPFRPVIGPGPLRKVLGNR